MIFEVLTAVNMLMFVFWISAVSIFKSSLKMEAVCFSETLVSTYKSPSVTTQKTNIDMYINVSISEAPRK
jgi:hypothetical protein